MKRIVVKGATIVRIDRPVCLISAGDWGVIETTQINKIFYLPGPPQTDKIFTPRSHTSHCLHTTLAAPRPGSDNPIPAASKTTERR